MTAEAHSAGSRRVLVVAYYFPPMGLSGVQRVLRFVRHLPEYGWIPEVLTVEPGAYYAFDETLAAEVETLGVPVHRSRSVDLNRLLGRNRTVSMPREPLRDRLSRIGQWVLVPDSKIGWVRPAVRLGRSILAERPFDTILASAPPYSGLIVGEKLAREHDVPLVVDFRDDWLGNPRHRYPTLLHRAVHRRLERRVVRTARRIVTINGTIGRAIEARHPGIAAAAVIPHGHDPEDYPPDGATRDDVFEMIYTGVFYDAQRPGSFLEALAAFLLRRPDARPSTRATFVGLFPDAARNLVSTLGLQDVVEVTGYVPHRKAMAALSNATVAWLVVGRQEGEEQISTGKMYAYVGARKPILALAPDGEVRKSLSGYGAAVCVAPDDVPAIATAVEHLHDAWAEDRLPQPDELFVKRYDRRNLTARLASVLDGAVATRDRQTVPS